MRINFVVTNPMKVGGIRIILEYAFRLQEKGNTVNVLYPFFAYNFHTERGVLYFIKRLYWSLTNVLNAGLVIRSFNVQFRRIKLLPSISNHWVPDADVIIASEWPAVIDIYKLKKSKGNKFYLIQGNEAHFSKAEYFKNAIELPVKKIVVSKYLYRLLKNKYGVESSIVNNAVDIEFFNNPKKDFNRIKKRILFIDSETEVKRTTDIYTALEKVIKLYPNTTIIAFGNKKSNKIPSFVQFFENPSDGEIKTLYCSSDIFVGASNEEGFYLAPAEAMACKCAVIVTKVGAVEEYSVHMKSAIHIDPLSPVQIVNAIEMLLNNPELLKRISIAGYDEVRRKMKWESSTNKMENILSTTD